MKTFVIIGNNVVQDTFIKAGLYTFNATIKSHLPTHVIGFKGASGWVDVELPTNPDKFTKAHAIFELKEDVTQISLCRNGASTTNPIIVQTPMWTEGNNISTPSPNPADLDETTSNVDIKLSTQILQTNEKIQLIATEEQFDELGQGGVTAFGMIKVMAGDIELKVGKDGVISSINQSAEEIKISADRIRFAGSAEFENAVKDISPDAIIIEVGIPYYEFKKAEGSPYAEYEVLDIPVYANIGDNREFLNVGAITSNTNITGLSIQQVEANKVRITAQSNLGASAGTVILKVEVRGKKYLADFNFKVVEKPKDGKDGEDGKDGKDGKDGVDGVDGKGISIKGSVDNYNQLSGLTGLSAGDAYLNKSDGKLYIWDGFNFPPNGQGILFQGEAGKDGKDGLDGENGLDGVSISSLIQQYINHTSKTVQPAQNANWLDVMPKYEDGLYMWSRFKMTLSNGQVQYSSYSLLEDFEAMMDASRIKNLVMYGDFSGEMKEIKSSNPVNYYPIGWKVSGLSHDSNGVPSDQNNIAPKIIKINTGLPKGMLAGLRITPKTNLQGIYQKLSTDLVLNEVHTAYVFARKRNASSVAQVRLKYGSITVTEALTTTWARYVLKFTPISQQPFEILFNKTGAWTANDEIEISKIQLARTELIFDYRPFSYVENAFAGSTSIEGGVVATRMVILNNEGGEIKSYVSGIDAAPSAFAAGVSGFGTDTEKKNIDLRHDGTGRIGALKVFANGRVSTGNGFEIDETGKIKATGGDIGSFAITAASLESVSGNNSMLLSSNIVRFLGQYSSVYIGADTFPASNGGAILGTQRISIDRSISGTLYGNVGMHISVKGATAYDNSGYEYTGNHALYIPNGSITGVRFRTIRVSGTLYLTNLVTNVIVADSNTTIWLPNNPEDGQMYWINPNGFSSVTLRTYQDIWQNSGNKGRNISLSDRTWHLFIYDRVNSKWLMSWMNA